MGSTRPQVERRKDPEDLFSTTLPLKLIRYVISRRATRRGDGQERKTKYIDVKKAHLVPECTQDVYVPACSACLGGALFRCANHSWLQEAFYHPERDLVGVVHGDDLVFVGVDKELDFVLSVFKEHF